MAEASESLTGKEVKMKKLLLLFRNWLVRKLKPHLVPTDKESMLQCAMGFIKQSQVVGDYLEFGVANGDTFCLAYHLGKDLPMNFYAFDSFKGLPQPSGIDDTGEFYKGQHAHSLDTFVDNLRKKKVDFQRVHIYEGFFENSLRYCHLPRKIAIAYVDCDLYFSTVSALKFIRPYLQEGTVIVFDDFFCFKGNPDKGQQKAFNEWDVPFKFIQYQKFGWHINSFIVTKKWNIRI